MAFEKLDQHAVIGFARNNPHALLAALHQVRKGVQAELAICIRVVMAVDAVGVEERNDMLRVVHGLGGGGGDESHQKKSLPKNAHSAGLMG